METVENLPEDAAIMLPEELVVKILQNMDYRQLKTHLSIKDHRDLIMKNSEMMRKLPLIAQNSTWHEKIPFIRSYGNLIKEIKFNDCGFDSIDDVGSIINLCENVETIQFHNCYLKTPENEPVRIFC